MNWDDYDQVLEAVKRSGCALQFASEELKANETIVLEAVKQNRWALGYASKELRANETIVMEAVKQYGSLLECASEKLRGNETFIAECLYELYNLNKLQEIKKFWEYVLEEIKEKYENQWEPLIASYYHRIE